MLLFFPKFADTDESYCVAAGSLKAVTYWCQGKKSCGFPAEWIIDVGETRSGEKRYFIKKLKDLRNNKTGGKAKKMFS